MSSNALWWRALIAMVLMVGFYALSIAIGDLKLSQISPEAERP